MKFKLVIGDKIYSTWSLRPWLLLKYFNIPFAEAKIKLRDKNTKINILKFSPSGKIPCLIYGKKKYGILYQSVNSWQKNLKIKIYGQKIILIK
jgi:glutathione S-transferase